VGFTILVMLIGILAFSYITATIISSVSVSDQADKVFFEKLSEVESFCKALGVHSITTRQVLRYFSQEWKKPHRRINWSSVMDDVPEDLRVRIVMDLFPTLTDVSLIEALDDESLAFTKRFISYLEPLQFAKGEYIFKTNDVQGQNE
jgi:hypothetical protein